MSFFENQVAYSKEMDEEALNEAYMNIAGSVVGRKLQRKWQNDSFAAKTALEDICKYYRIRPRDIPDNMKDLNDKLDYLFQSCGYARRNIKLKKGWYGNAVGAMLGVFKDTGAAVALIPAKMGGYIFRSPETGEFVRVNRKNAELIEDEAVVFYRPLPLRPIKVKDLIIYMKNCLDFVDVFWFLVVSGIVTLLGLIMPKLTNILFSQVTEYKSLTLLLGVIIFMLCQTITVQIISGIKALLLTKINTKLDLSVQAACVMRVFALPATFFKNYTSGELNQYVAYMNNLCSQITGAFFSTAITGVFSLVYITQIFKYSRALVLPSIIILLVTLVFGIITVLLNINISKQLMENTATERGIVYSIITGIQKIRLCGAEKRAFSRWGNIYSKESKLTYSPPTFLKYSSVFSAAIGSVGTIVLYYAAAKNGVTVADYYSFSTAYAYISAAFGSLIGITSVFASIKPILQIIKPIMDASPELSEEKEVVTRLGGGIEVSHVTFSYPESDIKVLDDISLKIKPGQYVAIVGESGCGKSTLLRILLGFETPKKGAVYYDGKNIDKLDKKSLRRKIGVVLQGGKLMWGDIFANITVSAPWLDLNAAWEAAEIAGIADDIRAMPMGMNTIVQEGSGGISGGQRQRLMIARAVAPKPKILFLDEATSALDNITQKKVCDAMDKMKCTRVVVAHRLSTIRQCDRVILIKNGKIAEDGSYEELLNKNGLFTELVKRQLVDQKQ